MKRNRLLCLLIFIIGIFSVGVIGVKAGCTNCDPDVYEWEEHNDDSGTIGGGGACIRNSLCGNSNFITIRVDFAHLKAHTPTNVMASIQFTNNPSLANGTTVIYEPSLTKEKYAYGVATAQIEKMFSANNGALARDYLTKLGVTDFSGIHGSDAFGAVFQPMVQFKNASGQMQMATMKEYAAIATNKARILDFLSRVVTGTDDVLQYVQGMTSEQCKAAGLAVAASSGTGCGMAILDLACLWGIIPEPIPPKTCPGGDMVKSGSFGKCEVSESKDGQSFGFSYTATGGSKTNVHRALGEETKSINNYCSIYCQEFGTATLPGATGEALALGSYIIWPTSKDNHDNSKFKKGFYPLKFSGQLYCKMGIRPDANLPGSNGACFEDPAAVYRENWIYLKATWNQKDYSNKTFEEVRYDYTKLQAGMCGPNYNDWNNSHTSCGKKMAEDGPFAGCRTAKIIPCQYKIEEALPGEEECKKDYYEDYQDALKAYNDAPDTCKHCERYGDMNQYEHCEDPCPAKKKDLWAKAQDAKAKYEAQKALVDTLNQMKQQIKDNVRTCQTYTEKFRQNREIVKAYHQCDNSGGITEEDYDFDSSATLSWNDEEYFNIGNVKKYSSTKTANSAPPVGIPQGEFEKWEQMEAYHPDVLDTDIGKLKRNEYIVNAEDVYALDTGYKYIDKKSNKYKKSKSELKNYLDITKSVPTIKSVIPTSYDNIVGKNYKLILKSIRFGQVGWSNSEDYVCKQDFTKTNDSCKCPSGYKFAGRSLTGYLKNNHKTCADLQADKTALEKYCNDPKEDSYYCPAPHAYICLDGCINAGSTYDECVKEFCPGERNFCIDCDGKTHYLDTLTPKNGPAGECRADESKGPGSECEARLCPSVCKRDPFCKDQNGVWHFRYECGNKETDDECKHRLCEENTETDDECTNRYTQKKYFKSKMSEYREQGLCKNGEPWDHCKTNKLCPSEIIDGDKCTNRFTQTTYYKKYFETYKTSGQCDKNDNWSKCKKKLCPDKALCYYDGEWYYENDCTDDEKNDKDLKDCKDRLCPSGAPGCQDCGEKIKCKNTNGVGGLMDITSCVQTKMTQGKTRQEAIDECDSVMCPLGKFIIYRTIKMENPFPGKNISNLVSGFNDDVKGRYQGYNWNSKALVKSKIRENRGADGTTIYETKEPLYSFELDGVTIEALRDYNKNQKEGYNDFTLDCKNEHMFACVSKVVHNAHLSGLVGGTCQNIGINDGFYKCAEQ